MQALRKRERSFVERGRGKREARSKKDLKQRGKKSLKGRTRTLPGGHGEIKKKVNHR